MLASVIFPLVSVGFTWESEELIDKSYLLRLVKIGSKAAWMTSVYYSQAKLYLGPVASSKSYMLT